MNQNDTPVLISRTELQDMLDKAAIKGARQALKDIGLGDENAAEDMRALRDWFRAYTMVKRVVIKQFVSTLISTIIKAAVLLMTLGLAAKLGVKLIG